MSLVTRVFQAEALSWGLPRLPSQDAIVDRFRAVALTIDTQTQSLPYPGPDTRSHRSCGSSFVSTVEILLSAMFTAFHDKHKFTPPERVKTVGRSPYPSLFLMNRESESVYD